MMQSSNQTKPIAASAIVIALLILLSLHADAVGVRPMILDLDLKPGETVPFEIILTPGQGEEVIDLSLYQPVQLLTGALAYQQPEHEAFSAVGWVTLDKDQVSVYPGEETKVTGTVQVPFSAGGSHTVVIMVEPQTPTAQQGITFQVRYAVRLNIRVERPGLRHVAEVAEFGLQPGDEGQPVVRAVIDNPSAWDYLVFGEVTIRDQERRLVERVPLQSPASQGAGVEVTRLYPGSKVEFLGEITKRLSPGTYFLRAYFRYGDQGQLLRNEEVVITEGEYVFPSADEIGVFSLNPSALNDVARAGERKSKVIEVSSEIGETARIEIGVAPISDGYPFSLEEWIQFRMMGDSFELPGRRTTRLGITLAIPRDIDDGSYHGLVTVRAFALETDELLSEASLPISMLIGSNHQASVDVRSLQGLMVSEDRAEFILDIYNTGSIPLRPQASVVLTDGQGQFAGRGLLILPEDENEILPLKGQHLEGEINDLLPGFYLAQVSIQHDGQEIYEFEQEIEIK
jgi:hypothetical protein